MYKHNFNYWLQHFITDDNWFYWLTGYQL